MLLPVATLISCSLLKLPLNSRSINKNQELFVQSFSCITTSDPGKYCRSSQQKKCARNCFLEDLIISVNMFFHISLEKSEVIISSAVLYCHLNWWTSNPHNFPSRPTRRVVEPCLHTTVWHHEVWKNQGRVLVDQNHQSKSLKFSVIFWTSFA